MLMLKLQYFGHWMHRADSLEKTLMLGKTEVRRGWQRMSWLRASPAQCTGVWETSGWQWRTGKLSLLQSVGSPKVRQDFVTEQQHMNSLKQWDINKDDISRGLQSTHTTEFAAGNPPTPQANMPGFLSKNAGSCGKGPCPPAEISAMGISPPWYSTWTIPDQGQQYHQKQPTYKTLKQHVCCLSQWSFEGGYYG